jgi:hypothetical protein
MPIFRDCPRLSVISVCAIEKLTISSLFSILRPRQALSSLEIDACWNPLAFKNLVEPAKNVPNIRNVKLPWPTYFGEHQIPERLMFNNAQLLANAWKRLDEMDLQVTKTHHTKFWMWEIPFIPSSPNSMPFDRQKPGFGPSKLEYLEFLQHIK